MAVKEAAGGVPTEGRPVGPTLKGPALSVKVGSYRYDPLSELHDTKLFGT
jgi:hypothetical protein